MADITQEYGSQINLVVARIKDLTKLNSDSQILKLTTLIDGGFSVTDEFNKKYWTPRDVEDSERVRGNTGESLLVDMRVMTKYENDLESAIKEELRKRINPELLPMIRVYGI